MWWKGALVSVMVVAGTSCIFNDDDFTTIEYVCVNVCDCVIAFPAGHELCVNDCVADLEGFTPPEPCLACFAEASCRDLRVDQGLCDAECGFFATSLPINDNPEE